MVQADILSGSGVKSSTFSVLGRGAAPAPALQVKNGAVGVRLRITGSKAE